MKHIALVFLVFISLSSLASDTRYISPDFFISTVDEFPLPTPDSERLAHFKVGLSKPVSCRDNIEKTLCLVEPNLTNQDPLQRKCLTGSKKYADKLEKLYDAFPLSFQKMFCSLKVIFVEKAFEGTAYAGLIKTKEGKVLGAQMGIRQSVLEQDLKLKTWATWKDQLNFGLMSSDYQFRKDLPLIHTRSKKSGVSDFLYFLVAHEFAHIFDFANEVNVLKNCPEDNEDAECELMPRTWGAIDWLTNLKPKPMADFFNRDKLCFYWCGNNPISFLDIPQLYESFSKASFVSLYAASQPWDDFADSTAYFMLSQKLGTSYSIETRQGKTYDIIRKLYSSPMKNKVDYLRNFYSRKDLVYP